MPPHEAMLPAAALPAAPDPDGLRADEATVVFAERLRFAVVLRQVAVVAFVSRHSVLDLSTPAAREEWGGSIAVLGHARTLRLTGWADADGVWRRE